MKRLALLLAISAAFSHTATAQTIWTGSWAAAPVAAPMGSQSPDSTGTTFRDIVHLSLGGKAIRLKISNEFGVVPLAVSSVHVALSANQPDARDAIQPASDRAVTFGGSENFIIPAGAMLVSDPVAMPVEAFNDLAVSIFLTPQPEAVLTYHASASSTNFVAGGNKTTAVTLDGAKKVPSWFLLKGIDVDAGPSAFSVVTFGDSITDGAKSTPDKNTRWPDVLAARLHANPATVNVGVLDEGIGGNRILHDGSGPDALARFDRDVLAQTNAKVVIVMLGINDIGRTSLPRVPADGVTIDQLTLGLRQLAERAHARGMKIYGATLTPYGGAFYQDDAGMKMHAAVNRFIRTSGVFDAVLDFEKLTHDPANNKIFLAPFDSGDHLHPGDAGYKAMGDSIDLKLFQ